MQESERQRGDAIRMAEVQEQATRDELSLRTGISGH